MSATKILWGQLIVLGLIVLAFVWAATQWTAWRLGYQPQLGAPWFELWHGMPVYAPPAFFWWWFHFDAYAPPVFVEGAYIASSGGFASILVAIAMSVWRAREAREVTTYGTARFATEREVRAAGLLGDDGAILGRLGQSITCATMDPSTSSASRRPAAARASGLSSRRCSHGPAALSCTTSRARTGRSRQAGAPASAGCCASIRPARVPTPTTRCWRFAVAIARCAMSRTSPISWSIPRERWSAATIGRRPAIRFWSGQSCTSSTPNRTRRWPASPTSCPTRSGRSRRHLRAMMTTPHLGPAGVHPVVASAGRELLNKSENERSGVLSTAMSFLGPVSRSGRGKSHQPLRLADR